MFINKSGSIIEIDGQNLNINEKYFDIKKNLSNKIIKRWDLVILLIYQISL